VSVPKQQHEGRVRAIKTGNTPDRWEKHAKNAQKDKDARTGAPHAIVRCHSVRNRRTRFIARFHDAHAGCGCSRSHRRCWTSRPDLGERRPSRLVATAAEDRLSIKRNLYTLFAAASNRRAIVIYEYAP